jgi:hypothetical protein
MIALARFFDWRSALVIVKPATFLRWHRNAFRLFWKWKLRKRGRPSSPRNLRQIIQRFVRENPTWERIESPTTTRQVRNPILAQDREQVLGFWSTPRCPGRSGTFVRNHARAIAACDFFVSVSATFRVFYVFVAMEIGSRQILRVNVTCHPTEEWTIQQFREFLHMQLKMSSSANSCAEPKI